MALQLTLSEAIKKSYQLLKTGKSEAAFDLAYKIYKHAPHQAHVFKLLGLLHSSQVGNVHLDLCLASLERCLKLGLTNDFIVYLTLAKAYLSRGVIKKAHQAINEVQRIKPESSVARLFRARCYIEEQKWSEANEILEQLKKVDSLQQTSTGWQAIIASSQGDFHTALNYLISLNLSEKIDREEDFLCFQHHLQDLKINLLPPQFEKKILVVRHVSYKTDFYQVFLDWVQSNYPQYQTLFELRLLPCQIKAPDQYAFLLPWLQDPVQNWSEQAFIQASQLEAQFTSHHKKVVNPVTQLINATKYEAQFRFQAVGLNTPKMVEVTDFEQFKQDYGGLSFPFFIRENWGHGGLFKRVNSSEDLLKINIQAYKRPVAVELIDVQSQDGLYRKYRYFAIGQYGISHHLLITQNWITRGGDRIYTDAIKAEELAFIAEPNPHHEIFQKAAQAMGLDFVSFDYAYDKQGNMIVWEANPYTHIRWPGLRGGSSFRVAALHRTMVAMLLYYLDLADLIPPPELSGIVAYDPNYEHTIKELKRPQNT